MAAAAAGVSGPPAAAPRVATRWRIVEYRVSRSLSRARIGDAMKIDE